MVALSTNYWKKICCCQPLHFAGFLRYWKQNQVSVRKPTHAPSTRPLSAIGPPQVNRPTGARPSIPGAGVLSRENEKPPKELRKCWMVNCRNTDVMTLL